MTKVNRGFGGICFTTKDSLQTLPKNINPVFVQEEEMLVRCSEDSEALLEYIRNNREELDNLDEDIFEAAAAIGEMKQLQEITENTEGGSVEMCKALDDIISNAEERGREIGREIGMKRGREIEYSDAIVHVFRKFRAPFSGKAVHTFPE